MKRLREASLEKVKAVDGIGPKLAEQIGHGAPGDVARLELLWLRTLNRPLTPDEKKKAQAFVAGAGQERWVELCHALLATNEFLMTF